MYTEIRQPQNKTLIELQIEFNMKFFAWQNS